MVRTPAIGAVAVEVADAPTATAALTPVVHRLTLEPGEHRVLDLELVPRRRGADRVCGRRRTRAGPAGARVQPAALSRHGLDRRDLARRAAAARRAGASGRPSPRRPAGRPHRRPRARVREPARLRARRRVPAHLVEGDARAAAGRWSTNMQPERRQSLMLAVEAGRLMAGPGGARPGEARPRRQRLRDALGRRPRVRRRGGPDHVRHGPEAALEPAARPGQMRRVSRRSRRSRPSWSSPTGAGRSGRRRASPAPRSR